MGLMEYTRCSSLCFHETTKWQIPKIVHYQYTDYSLKKTTTLFNMQAIFKRMIHGDLFSITVPAAQHTLAEA